MAQSDYLNVYRQFFEDFAESHKMEDHSPMRVNLYNLSVDELVGEVMQSCVNFLTERQCPKCLVVPLTKIVVEELLSEAKKQYEEVNTPLKLNKKTLDKIAEVCLRYTDNEKLSSLPAPVRESPFTTHSTKHTRRRMEDRLICLSRFNTLHGIQSDSEAEYYGIFDGHGGVNAACFAVSHLHQFLAESEHYPKDVVRAFRQAYEKTEARYNAKGEDSGTTSLAILYQPGEKRLTVSWVGDSQAMLVTADSYVMLVDPHKPERTDETKRIEKCGGCVIKAQNIYRVNGGLAVSRAIGDKKMKPYVSAEPEFRVLNLTGTEHFVVMGCDGLWDVVEPEEVIETVYFELKINEGQIDTVARRLVDLAKENDSTDNISVIVLFLTDPSEIRNTFTNPTGHRPKVLLQDGVIMDADFQANDKLLLNDSGMNKPYETNGNHSGEHMKNESDEDYGPETDVDAIDEVFTSPKAQNPFANDSWPKSQTHADHPDKLIEFAREDAVQMQDEFAKYSSEFTESVKNPFERDLNEGVANNVKATDGKQGKEETSANDLMNLKYKNNSDDILINKELLDKDSKGDFKLSELSFDDPREGSVTDNHGNAFNSRTNGSGTDKYVEEVDIEKEQIDNIMSSNKKPYEFETNDVEDFENHDSTEKIPIIDFSEGLNSDQNDSNNISEGFDDDSNKKEANDSATKNDFMNSTFENYVMDTNSVNMNGNQTPFDPTKWPWGTVTEVHNTGVTPAEFTSKHGEGKVEISDDVSPMKDEASAPDSFTEPTAPALGGDVKDDVIAESGGEVEDSEDDEWNYIKVNNSFENKTSDLNTSTEEDVKKEESTMNSPLNPDAAEFVPVTAADADAEFANVTPVKVVPRDLSDIVASSPNWSNMENVNVPDEFVFLEDIKSKPSNIFEGNQSSIKMEEEALLLEENDLVANALTDFSKTSNAKEERREIDSSPEIHGISLAHDMTSSFIDPTTMSSPNDDSKEHFDLIASEVTDSFNEKKTIFFNDKTPSTEEIAKANSETCNLPELDSFNKETNTSEMPKPSKREASLPFELKTTISESTEMPIAESLECTVSADSPATQTPPSTPLANELLNSHTSEGILQMSVIERERSKEPLSTIGGMAGGVAGAVAGGVGVTAGVISEIKKDDKKQPSLKTATAKTSKTSSSQKPLVNGVKTNTPAKRPSTQTARTPLAAKTASNHTTITSPSKLLSKATSVTKTNIKTSSPVTSTLNKTPARSKVIAASASSKAPLSKTTITTVVSKTTSPSPKPSARASTTTSTLTASRPKPRVPSAPLDRKPISNLNGELKTTAKRTEITTTLSKKPATTPSLTTTRVSLSSRPATAPPKPTNLKATQITSRTVTAKPRTSISNMTTTNTITATTRLSTATRKSAIGPDKQAKELANRIKSKSTTVTKMNGVAPGKTTTTIMQNNKTRTSSTTPSKTKIDTNKTETKAEKILDKTIEIIQPENPLIENKDINLINSIASD